MLGRIGKISIAQLRSPRSQQAKPMSQWLPKLLKFLPFGLVALGIALAFPYIETELQGLYDALDTTWQFTLNLMAMGLIALIVAGLLIPLETLGWWAGWYGDPLETQLDPGTLVKPLPPEQQVSRYVIYLDGIAQSKFQYLPEAENFLTTLESVLPDDILIVKGLMPYSPVNRPLTEERFLSFFWRLATKFQGSESLGFLGFLGSLTIQLRNMIVVAISADRRYGPIYNRGTAQVMYNSLINHGYEPDSGIPITLVGYSGGAQISLAAAPYLRQTLKAPIEVISIAGVFSGNQNALQIEHFHHFVGDKDVLERLGAILFPKRWAIAFLSYWNRAKRRGKISINSLGEVGHNDAGGPFDDKQQLADGRSFLQQTVEAVANIILGNITPAEPLASHQPSNYERYQQAPFNQPSYYPIEQNLDPQLYQPIGTWMGRLILPSPKRRRRAKGVLMELYCAEPAYQEWVGQKVRVQFARDSARIKDYVRAVTKDVYLSEEAKYSQSQGAIHPERLNRWQQVNPLESLAGSRKRDDMVVLLREVRVKSTSPLTLEIARDPIQIAGRFYALVQILHPVGDRGELFCVVHFNRQSRQFDGPKEFVRFPEVIANGEGICPSTMQDIERSPQNQMGWYIYGAQDRSGTFVASAIAPRSLFRLQPDRIVTGESACREYLTHQTWASLEKGTSNSVLLCPYPSRYAQSDRPQLQELPKIAQHELLREAVRTSTVSNLNVPASTLINQWQQGDRALVLHVYGGIGGQKRESAAKTPIFFGHFAYGVAQVVWEPLAEELRFEIDYLQVYTHNVDGIIAGTLAWNRFIGDRQWGWLGTRPVCDLLVKLDAFTDAYQVGDIARSPLDIFLDQLEVMTARYRIGDGTGGTYVGPAHNCAQDSNQALYAAIRQIQKGIDNYPEIAQKIRQDPQQGERFEQLIALGKGIKRELLPFGAARADWRENSSQLGISPEEDAISSLLVGLMSWRSLFPRKASETVAKEFLYQGALIWVLRTNQVGGYDPDIEPLAPTPIG
ncbi:MAG: CAAX protease [Desertifilum sp.]|nr:CAAX protease [Desertifilum sp.]